jgi:release factor glutamine methyltransferase
MNNKELAAKTLFKNIYDALIKTETIQSVYTDYEVRNIVYLMIERISGASRTDVIVNRQIELDDEKAKNIEAAIERIKNHEPIQYITGEGYFYGRKFIVTPEVLIPRRETEELVHLIVAESQHRENKILDIGTGSGCIPITLKKEIKNAEVYAIDISKKALNVAKDNANILKAPINFYHADICSNDFLIKSKQEKIYHFDTIVSNPPYVRNSESQNMDKNVLNYEPHLALFVTDKDPLLFYRTIISLIKDSSDSELYLLKKGGKLFFEVNESFAEEVADLLQMNNFEEIKVVKDLQQKNRFVTGKQSI